MKKLILLLLAVGLASILVACGDDDEANEGTDEQGSQEFEVTEDEKVPEDEVVVSINGMEVTGDKYNPVYSQTKMQMFQYGFDINDQETLKEQTLNEIIAQELIMQEADRQGIEVSEEEVEEELELYKGESEEEFMAYLDQFQLTEDEFKDQVRFTLVLDQYMEQELTVDDISDEEVRETYDEINEESEEEIITFEEAEEVLREQLAQQKQGELLQTKIDELREEATIEQFI